MRGFVRLTTAIFAAHIPVLNYLPHCKCHPGFGVGVLPPREYDGLRS